MLSQISNYLISKSDDATEDDSSHVGDDSNNTGHDGNNKSPSGGTYLDYKTNNIATEPHRNTVANQRPSSMAIDTASTAGEVPCPDPSVHDKHNRLSEQASTAALYVTQPHAQQPRDTSVINPLGPDGKLSSKSAAASLKYARAQDLPSYPTVGIDTSNSAGKAAMIAKDYKMKDLWHPELSSAGSKAALIAHRDGGKLDLWEPTASKEGNSAATLAMRNKNLSPQLDYGYTDTGRSNALLAATKSQRQGRQRAGSTPVAPLPQYPDSANSAANALSAATMVARRASVKAKPSPAPAAIDSNRWSSAAMQAARIQNSNVDRAMYTERPPVEIEEEERRHQNALRASAVSMAKQMYDVQNRMVLADSQPNSALGGATTALSRNATTTGPTDLKAEAMRYIHLQEAAQKLAAERLAKVDAGFENARYKEYYGYPNQPKKSRLSIRGRGPKQAASEGQNRDLDSSDDEEQARRVRTQMSQFNNALADVDAKKQERDRAALLAAAEKKVHQSMHAMDEKVFQDTGKISQSMQDEWEKKARARAQEESELRQKNHGKTHVGGGKFMDQSEIEAIAAARLKPTLDAINVTAEKRRARDQELEALKHDQDKARMEEKMREHAGKEEWQRIRNEDKAAAKREKEERKAAARDSKQSNRKSVEAPRVSEEQEPAERRGFLSKFTNKRKSREVKRDDRDMLPAVATGAGVGGAIGEHTESPVHGPEEPEEVEEDVLSSDGDAVPAVPVAAATAEPSHATEAGRPDLERHITTVETSDESENEVTKPKLSTVAAGTETHAEKVAERVAQAPATTMGEGPVEPLAGPASTPAVKTGLSSNDAPQATGEKRGVRGFFSKFRSGRESRSENKLLTKANPSDETPAAGASNAAAQDAQPLPTTEKDEPTDGAVGATLSSPHQHIGTDGQIGDSQHVSGIGGNPGAASPSSFRRHKHADSDDGDVSSLSSSGLDEDDIEHPRGRGGRTAGAFGLGTMRSGKTDAARQSSLTDDDSDQFEEAKDHFDASLAPEPAFAGQRKSGSPARETKFVEEL